MQSNRGLQCGNSLAFGIASAHTIGAASQACFPGSMTPTEPVRATFLDCEFDPVTMPEAVARAVAWCGEPRQAHLITTVNASTLVMMRRDPEFAAACGAGDLIVADGVPVVWAARLAGVRLPGRVAGVDLMAELLRRASTDHLSVYFLGAREDVLNRLLAVCRQRYPVMRVAGARNGYFDPTDSPAIVEAIRASGADMLFVGMPSPFKEVWCHQHAEALGVPVIMGVGGSFDVISGAIERAPKWMQGAGLEWFWRLLMEPRRMWKRYLVTNTLFLAQVARETARRRLAGLRPSAHPQAGHRR